ncbi:MAG: glycosyltransferase family 2 protein [Candidatus Pacebacteria bacterium]|jgi:dolichyl-phosphate beta-glucosyltransferase|nr:glycosyltransferase family 2 protein [Candidatus Paceibacterota bacterium]MBT4651989.1 glycosyltransferase family 2 protein [Candidatus Paceibacterota bacterium]MBT6756011.1 glycosyltransferase family 2 protein [Candidatus Paceibacterota bacterium]MBT6920801.1 glycosyltransferase family 2 protein [Candidatus Paceibacterota bacterium]
METTNTPFLSVIVPSYNEMKNLKRGVIEEMLEFLNKQKYSWEIILTDDGSTDGTIDVLKNIAKKNPNVNVLANVHAGKGPTVKAGMLSATGKWRLFTDFDQSTPLEEVEKLLKFTETHKVIFGSREIAGAKRDKEPFYRHLMGRGFNLLVQILAVRGVKDTQCGFKLFSAESTEKLFPALYVYGGQQSREDAFTGAFDVELLFLARKFKVAHKEVPILWKHHNTDRVSPIKDSLRMLRDIIKIRIAYLMGKYRANHEN